MVGLIIYLLMRMILLLVIVFFLYSFSYGTSYRIHNLSLIDGVFSSFRQTILRFKDKGSVSGLAFRFRFKLALYRLKDGDNLKNLSGRLGLDTDTLISLNSFSSSYDLVSGRDIYIPNIRGTFIYLDEELDRGVLSSMYDIPLWLLLEVNKIKRDKLYRGERVFIPFRGLSVEEREYFDSSIFHMPVSYGYLSSSYGLRFDPFNQRKTFHGGLDIAASYGSFVYASQGGKVIFAGYKGGYGNLVIVSHKYNYKTFYGHLSKILVVRGDSVVRGGRIGRVGSTGRSTGPHLHFEIRRFNSRLNPLKFIHK